MSQTINNPNDPNVWLLRASSNLHQAGHVAEGICLEDLCFACQQAAEKALKAVLIAEGVPSLIHTTCSVLFKHSARMALPYPIPLNVRSSSLVMPLKRVIPIRTNRFQNGNIDLLCLTPNASSRGPSER